jgi:aldose 1-epimerase
MMAGVVVLMVSLLASCQTVDHGGRTAVTAQTFGRTSDGQTVTLYTLDNGRGIKLSVMNYGATIVKLLTPDRKGNMGDITLGFDDFAPYQTRSPYFGAIVGRYANRIREGKFSLEGQNYQLAINNPPNTLHGGNKGFDKQMWRVEIADEKVPSIRFSRVSADGEEGYPGNLQVSVDYTLTANNELFIAYKATTDRTTIINLSNHAYFNLAGQGNGTILNQQVTLNASHYIPVDATLIPTGKIAPVGNTPMDFRHPTAVGKRLRQVGGDPIGYDHNFVLDKKPGGGGALQFAAAVYDTNSGRLMKIYTDQPGIQFYSGNFLDGTIKGKGGKVYPQYSAIVLEPQHFPDSPNQPDFPSTVLKSGTAFSSTTRYVFETK